MTERRTVDELTTEELEQVLIAKRQAARAERMRRLREIGRLPSDASIPLEDLAAIGIGSGSSRLNQGTVARQQLVYDMEPSRGNAQRKRQRRRPRRSRREGIRDRLLFVLEIGALVGLATVLTLSSLNLKALNGEYPQASQLPLPSSVPPTPVTGGILPDEHDPPDRSAGVPTHLRKLVKGEVPPVVPIPTTGLEDPSRVVVPTIGVDAIVVEGDSWEQLKLGVGHRLNTAKPGERGNMVLSAHNDIYGEIFRDLDDLELGDEVIVYAGEQPYYYTITAKKIVEPTEVSVLAPTTQPVVTLISCYPYMVDTHRIVIVAELR